MILDKILAAKREEIQLRKEQLDQSVLAARAAAAPTPKDFLSAIRKGPGGTVRLIAEFKRASPSRGAIRTDLDPAGVAKMYAKAGAAAMSVLTEEKYFSGSIEDLKSARKATEIPLLEKDFIIDEWQIPEARAAGADAILLIAAALTEEQLVNFNRHAEELGMTALIEIHDEQDLEKAFAADPRVIGINNRDLKTFRVNLDTTVRLRRLIPPGVPVVSESGIHSREDVLKLQKIGIDAILVGSSLMTRADPGIAAAELLGK